MADEQEEEMLEPNDVNMDYRRMRQTHELAGYRDGVESGKEAHLQQGFNEGFNHGAMVSKEWGKLRGTLSALMSIIDKSKPEQDSDQSIMATKIADLLTQVTQMERSALNAQTMKDILEIKLNQSYKFSQCSKGMKYVNDGEVDGNELASAFQALCAQDSTNRVGELEVDPQSIEGRTEGSDVSEANTVTHAVSHKNSGSLELHNTIFGDLEDLWSRTFSLAEEIGISRQKLLLVKDI